MSNQTSSHEEELKNRREIATAQLMRAIESATAQAAPETTIPAMRKRRTLRDDLYAGDFRDQEARSAPTVNP